MFEDIENILKNGEDKEKKNKRGSSNPRRIEDDIKKYLQDKYGIKAIQVPGGLMVDGSDAHKEFFDKIDGIMKTVSYIAEQLNIPPICLEATGKELTQGDQLKCPGGELKTVLKVGWKFVLLSNTDDQTKIDGVWFEGEIDKLNFIKKT